MYVCVCVCVRIYSLFCRVESVYVCVCVCVKPLPSVNWSVDFVTLMSVD